jgi:hypothetical protein
MEPSYQEPHRNEPKAPEPRPENKAKRFRIVKLEERIAPSKGGGSKHCVSGVLSCSPCDTTTASIE